MIFWRSVTDYVSELLGQQVNRDDDSPQRTGAEEDWDDDLPVISHAEDDGDDDSPVMTGADGGGGGARADGIAGAAGRVGR